MLTLQYRMDFSSTSHDLMEDIAWKRFIDLPWMDDAEVSQDSSNEAAWNGGDEVEA